MTHDRTESIRVPVRERLVPAVLRVSFSTLRVYRPARHRVGIAAGAGAVACFGRGASPGRHCPLRGFFGGAAASQSAGHDRRTACGGLQRSAGTAATDRNPRRIRGRCSVSRLAAPIGATSDHSGPHPAGV